MRARSGPAVGNGKCLLTRRRLARASPGVAQQRDCRLFENAKARRSEDANRHEGHKEHEGPQGGAKIDKRNANAEWSPSRSWRFSGVLRVLCVPCVLRVRSDFALSPLRAFAFSNSRSFGRWPSP